MKKLNQLHVDVSAYFFAMSITVILCFFVSAMYYVELCARETLLTSSGVIYGLADKMMGLAQRYL